MRLGNADTDRVYLGSTPDSYVQAQSIPSKEETTDAVESRKEYDFLHQSTSPFPKQHVSNRMSREEPECMKG